MQQSPCNPDTFGLRACMTGVRSAPEWRKNVAQGVCPGFGSRLDFQPRRNGRNLSTSVVSVAPPGLVLRAAPPLPGLTPWAIIRRLSEAFHTHPESVDGL